MIVFTQVKLGENLYEQIYCVRGFYYENHD